jgi:hypothetical protein
VRFFIVQVQLNAKFLSSARLSQILRHEAALLEHIVTEQRYYPDYYRVAFYGNFPVAIRAKQFIVRLVMDSHVPTQIDYSLTSIVVMSGRNLEHSAKECSTNIPAHSCSRHQGTRLLTFVSATTNIFSVQLSFRNRTEPFLSSPTLTSHCPFAPTMSIGSRHIFYPFQHYD